MRGLSTSPLLLAVVAVLVAAALSAYSWYYSQQKAAEAAAHLNAKLVEEQARCLNAVAGPNGTVVVGGRAYNGSYTGLGCYVDPQIVVVVQWR